MSTSDLKIKCEVKNILVQQWVDTNQLNVSCHRGTVELRGSLVRVRREHSLVEDEIQSERNIMTAMTNIEERIRRIREVRRVVFDLDNFKKVGLKWQEA